MSGDRSARHPVRTCARYRRDGSRCRNEASHVDGWCRQPGCDGFIRSRAEIAPESIGAPIGTSRHIQETGGTPLPADVSDARSVRVSQRALDSFRFHHGGDEAVARESLRAMLDEFLVLSARSGDDSYVVLARDGYKLVLPHDLSVITAYSTIHRERTWAQLQAGIPSRFGRNRYARTSSGPQPDRAAPLPKETVAAAVDAANVHLTGRARSSFAKLNALHSVTDSELDASLRKSAESLKSGIPDDSYDGIGAVCVVAGDLRWLVRDDALVIIGVGRLRPPE